MERVLLGIVIGLVAVGGVWLVSVSSDASREFRAAGSQDEERGGEESGLSARVAALESRLVKIDELSATNEALRVEIRELERVVGRDAAAHEAGSTSFDETGIASVNADELRSFVLRVIDEERRERHDEKARKQEVKGRRRAEYTKGPYGNFNYQVNSIADKLAMTADQRDFYHETLVRFDASLTESRQSTRFSDAESALAFVESRRALQAELDDAVIAKLTVEQAEAYRQLPRHQRAPSSFSRAVLRVDDEW
jgi:hypothetical protein